MATNWWEIGKPVQDFEPVAQEKKEQNWWEIGQPVEEPPKAEVVPARSVETARVQEGPATGTSFQDLFGGQVTPELAATYRAAAGPSLPSQEIVEGASKAFAPETYANTLENLKLNAQLAADINELRIIDRLPASPKKQELQQQSLEKIRSLQEQIQANTPEDLNILQRGIRGAIETLPPMLAGTAASIATRSPGPALGTAGALTGIQSYGEARVAGKDPNIALSYGSIQAAWEVLTEVAPLDRLIKAFDVKDVSGLKDQLVAFAKKEIPSEQAATLLQSLTSLAFGLDQELANAQSPAEAAKIQAERQAVTAVSTIVAGGVQATGIGAANRIREEVIRRDIESKIRDLEGVGTEIEQRELQKLRDQAFEDAQTITAPELNQIPLDQGQTEATPIQYGDAYAQRVYDSIGRYIPVNAEFKVEEKVIDGTPRFVVTDNNGVQYGQTLQDKAQADAFSLSLNNTTKSRAELIKQLEPLQTSLTETLKGFGLNDVGLTLSDRIFTRRGEALTSEGLFDPVVRRVFLAVDAIDPQGNLDTTQRREALRGVLRHEVVHALRYLDLWKRSEWKNLENTVGKLKKPGTDKTYLEIAQKNYAVRTDGKPESQVVQVEEAIADLIRDVAGNISRVAGKPRSLSERAINFFDKAKNALTGAGFQTYEDIVQRFEQGDIGARQRGRIRTFRATEEQQAARGEVPERLQRLFTNPQERNQFRAEVAQRVEAQVPAVTAPARNSLRLNAVRESRSTVDPVPPKITVGEQEVPTRDSEGRLIYSGYEGPEVFGIQTRPTQEGLQNFWRWFGGSKAKDKQGRPQLFYHGTAADITEFRPKQAGSVFITRNPQFAEEFGFLSDNYMVSNFPDFMSDQQVLEALDETLSVPNAFSPKLYDEMVEARREAALDVQSGRAINPFSLKKFKDIAAEGRSSRYLNAIQKRLPSSANLMPVYVKADKPWDYDNKDDVKAVVKFAREELGADITPSMVEEIRQGNWQTIEGSAGNAPILDAIQYLGYDSMYVEEQGEKNLAVFNPGQIKSAVGNTGDFSPITPSIRESRKPIYNIINRITGQVVGKAATIAGANRVVDRKDNEYGSYVHTIQVLDEEADIRESNRQREKINAIIRQQGGTEIPAVTKPGGYNKQLPGATYGIKAPVSPLTLPITPSIKESRVAKPRQILFEVAPDPNNQPLTEAWRSLDPSVRLTISERVAKNIVPMVLDASGARGNVVSQVGSYLDDTNPSFALMLEGGDPLDIAKSIGFALSQDSMMVVAPNKFKGGDVVQSVTVRLGEKSPQEVASIYNSLREIEVDGNKPVGGQTFANGFMTILNYSDVKTDTLADLIDKKLNGEYNVLVTDVYSAFPEKKDYDYASPENDGTGKRADLRQRLRDIRAEATDSVQRELQGLATQGRAAAPAEAIVPAAREARRRGTPIGPTQPGPANDTDNTSAAEALNNSQPVDRIGTPSGPTISDTMPDGTVDISRARIAPLTKRLIVQMIQSAPDRLRSGVGLDDLAKRIENYYDTYSSRLGIANSIIRDAFNRIGFRDKNAALETFERFIRARENGRTEEAQAILDAATDSERQLIDAWNEIARQTGEINTSIRTPDGKPMRVWDAKRGEWRPIRSVKNFFPRVFRREVMEVMQNPDLDPVLWQSLLDSLVEAGRAETTQDAENYLLREWFSGEVTQDYFAGVEKARTDPLPEIFYDYSWDAATRYLRKWSRRTAQIENFGQTLGTFQKEWFDANIPKVRDQETQNYLNAIKERIYEVERFGFLTTAANWLNSLATATQLGNPISASLNLLGGTITNVQEFGIKEIAKAYIELAIDWKNVQKEGTTLGILNKDFMNILSDHVEMDADKYFSKEQKISQALAKFTDKMLTFGGFNGAENIVRSAAMLAARSRLSSFLTDVNEGRETKQVQAFREWVKRENLDIDALILENGAGKETERFMRRAVNVPQGSYSIDMTPVFIDTAAGRFFLKYQKFGTQINRFFYNHFLKPFYDNPNPKNFMRIAGFLGTAVIGGGAIIAIREAFGYGDPGPDDEEIVKAFENEDTARAWGLIFSRAWQNIMTAGSLGFFANYAQFAKDWQDQERVKNPLSPPGLASVEAVVDVLDRIFDQKKLTARDLDEIAEGTLSFYRANKRIALAGMDAIGVDAREVKRFAAQKEVREVREYGRRYSEAMDIEFKRRTAPGRIVRTPMTQTNRAITDALHQGDAARARLLIREAKSQVPFSERERVMASIRAAVRNRQPIQIGDSAPNQQERAAFMKWSRQNLPAEKYQMIRRADLRYKRAAARAGVGFGD